MSVKSETLLSSWSAFFVAHAFSIQKIEKVLAEQAPLSLHEYDVLLTVKRSPEQRLRYSELASVSVFTKSGITRILKRLEARGLINRVKCKSDGRGAFAELNKKGDKALKETWDLYSHEILNIFGPALTLADAKQLEEIMEKVIDQVRGDALVQLGSKESATK